MLYLNQMEKGDKKMSGFKIDDMVKLNTKTYKIVGTVKRSFLLEDERGKRYKATSKTMVKIKEQNDRGVGIGKRNPPVSILDHEENIRKIFMKENYKPMTLKEKFIRLVFMFEPENLSCDGELSRTAINTKITAIRRELKICEKEFGRKVTEDEVWKWAEEKREENYDCS